MTNIDLSTCHIKSKYSFEDLGAAADRLDAGEPMKAVLEDTGMSYSPVWRFWTWRTLAANDQLVTLSPTEGEAAKQVAALRAQDLSWGQIGVACSVPESRARKLFAINTGTDSVGTRTGKGGRFWGDAEVLYRGEGEAGERSAHGPQVEVGTTLPTAIAQVSDPTNMSMPLLRSAIRAAGHEGKLPKGKADLVKLYTEVTG